MSEVDTHAVILAAGVGKRLAVGGLRGDRSGAGRPMPKALLSFDGRSLLSRHIASLRGCGVRDITVVAGFEENQVLRAVEGDEHVRLVSNPDYRTGSVVSLWCARVALQAGRTVILMDADVLCEPRLLDRLVNSRHANAFLLDRAIEPGDEPVKLCVRDGRIVDFRKRPEAVHDWHGESVGFFRFTPEVAADLARRAGAYVQEGRRHMEYEEPIRDMVQASPGLFGFEDISGLPWTEIDFPEDIVKANALLPRMSA